MDGGRRRTWGSRVAGLGLVVVSALVLPGSVAAVPALQSMLWKIELNTVATKSEAGRIRDFDSADFSSISGGGALGLTGTAMETFYSPAERAATYSLAASNTTDVQVTCIPGEAFFDGSGSGTGRLAVEFEDGAVWPPQLVGGTFLFASAGTGFAKGAVGLKSEGDLSYDPTGEAAGLAEAVGDVSTELEGSAPLPGGGGVSYTPTEGEGRVTRALARDDTTTVQQQTFAFKLRNNVSADVKGDDGFVGQADASASATATHAVTLTGEECKDTNGNTSSISLRLRVQTDASLDPAVGNRVLADVTIRTRNAAGALVESIDRTLTPQRALFRRTERRTPANNGWGPPARNWAAAAGPPAKAERTHRPSGLVRTSKRLGVRRGAAASYAVAGPPTSLGRLREFRVVVSQANPRTGRVSFDVRASYRGGRRERIRVPAAIFSGKGDLRGLLVPAGLRRGERLYGVSTVTVVRGNLVGVRYGRGRSLVRAVYDRRTGWLLKLIGGNTRRPAFSITRR
jgi:hypothetical protein